jgi:uncharacterized protein YcfJ
MRSFIRMSTIAGLLVAVTAPSIASAQDYRQDRAYRGEDRRYSQDCRRSKGTTGLVAGGAGGALVGNALGGGVIGTVAGGVGGALLGKHLDKKHDAAQNRRNGC